MHGLVDMNDRGTEVVGARRPGILDAASSHYSDLAAIAGAELVELCRARVEALVLNPSQSFATDASQSEEAQACLSLTHQLCLSAQWVSDAQIVEVRRHLDPNQVFALVVAISLAERWYRLVAFTSGTGVER